MTVRPEDLARRLVERGRAERAAHARRAEELRQILRGCLRAAAARGAIRRAWIVGSLASGAFGARSDVDVVVEGLPTSAWASLWDELQTALAAPVDLLRLEELDAAFRARVLSEGVPVDVSDV